MSQTRQASTPAIERIVPEKLLGAGGARWQFGYYSCRARRTPPYVPILDQELAGSPKIDPGAMRVGGA